MMTCHVVTKEKQPSPRYILQEFSRLRKNDVSPPEFQWSACLGQQDTTSQDSRARLAG